MVHYNVKLVINQLFSVLASYRAQLSRLLANLASLLGYRYFLLKLTLETLIFLFLLRSIYKAWCLMCVCFVLSFSQLLK